MIQKPVLDYEPLGWTYSSSSRIANDVIYFCSFEELNDYLLKNNLFFCNEDWDGGFVLTKQIINSDVVACSPGGFSHWTNKPEFIVRFIDDDEYVDDFYLPFRNFLAKRLNCAQDWSKIREILADGFKLAIALMKEK